MYSLSGVDLLFLLSSYAEQLVLYLKSAELLSIGLQTAMEQVRTGKLCLSSTVKQGKEFAMYPIQYNLIPYEQLKLAIDGLNFDFCPLL